ncbi:hypothetical protein [Acinetobacter venetianus]|uniref:DUF1351 domain-containing protein n=1 Tax=Acinetobacter venetianus TaxID=52133 RepID=A0A150HU68_9GAMM|nr:hypothetical protein [Acinetobacter venetianus]KXZ70370.1 hypothetical protein AVENLUH13518_01854 [Acinetobacter venetianus]
MNAQVNELQVIDQNEIALAFNNDQGIQAIIDNIKAQVNEKFEGVVWDFSKKKDRDTVASLAYKVGRSKTAIDAEGKKLKEQYTVFTKKIDAERKLAREQLEAEQARIRKPLDEWEAAREAHIQAIKDRISAFDSGRVDAFSSSDLIKQVISEVEAIAIDESFEDFANEAAIKKDAALTSFKKSLEEALKREAEQAELERLRKEQLEREQRERDERIAKEAADKARLEAEAKALAEQRRVEREKQEAAEREARLIAEKKEAELRAQQAAVMERQRIEREQAAKEEAERKAEEARLSNVEHMRSINQAASKALIDLCVGLEEYQIKAVITAIARNQIPHVSIKY